MSVSDNHAGTRTRAEASALRDALTEWLEPLAFVPDVVAQAAADVGSRLRSGEITPVMAEALCRAIVRGAGGTIRDDDKDRGLT